LLELLKILRNVIRALSIQEKREWSVLLFLNTIVCIADVLSVVVLVFVIGTYAHATINSNALTSYLLANPLVSFCYFTAFVSLKNWIASLISNRQFRFSFKVAQRISKEGLSLFFRRDYLNYSKTTSSSLIRSISYQPIEFCQYVLSGFQQILNEVVLIVIVIITLLIFDSGITIILFLVLALPIYFVSMFIKSRLTKIRENIKRTNEQALQYLQESLNGYVEASLFEKKDFFVNRYSKEQATLSYYLSVLQSTQNHSQRILEAFGIIGLLLLFAANTYFSSPSSQIIVNIGIFLGAAYKLIPGIVKIISLSAQIRTFGYSSENLPVLPNLAENPISNSTINNQCLESISFNGVSFSYQDKSILKDFSVSLRKGDFVFINAPSGKGKTTFINLLLGFLESDKGQIEFNSQALKASERRLFWSKISYLKQDTFIINDTILKNITLDDKDFDKKLLEEAFYASGLDAFISKQEAGIDYVIAENGKNISGGQMQRIGLARAFYKKADVYIFDEAMNELDDESERLILIQLKKLTDQGHIVLLVSHNSRSQIYCNKTITLEDV
jgi:ABC-type multidrug transport system fused ATPase/permease subunit